MDLETASAIRTASLFKYDFGEDSGLLDKNFQDGTGSGYSEIMMFMGGSGGKSIRA